MPVGLYYKLYSKCQLVRVIQVFQQERTQQLWTKTAKQEESMMEWQSISENTCNHSSCVLETYSYKTVSASLRNYNKSLVQSTLMIQKNWR